ncbi:hypothetical protein N0Y54_42110 [Nostoc punctiforme UO1]|uniref:hypothetical protein n=1 Tax=Nostoc punctiforme TaxID=272131 RepID=UPI0030A9EA91
MCWEFGSSRAIAWHNLCNRFSPTPAIETQKPISGDRTHYPLPKSPKAVLHWALGVGEEAIARSHATLYSSGGPIRHWRLGIG